MLRYCVTVLAVAVTAVGLIACGGGPEWQSSEAVQRLHDNPDADTAPARVCGDVIGEQSGEDSEFIDCLEYVGADEELIAGWESGEAEQEIQEASDAFCADIAEDPGLHETLCE